MPLTRNGKAAAGSAAALLAAGVVADYPELVLLGLAGAAALGVGAVWMAAKPELSVHRDGVWPRRVTEGERATAALVVTNHGRRRSPPVSVDDGGIALDVPGIPGGGRHRHDYELRTDRRGRYRLAEPEVGHSDPLRLLRTGRASGTSAELYVHPRAHAVVPIPTGGSRDEEGPTSGNSPMGGVAFHSLREYVPGDDWRLVHWRTTARLGKPMVRHNVIPDEPRQLIVLDTRAAGYSDDRFEDAVRAATSLVIAASGAGYPLAVRTTAGGRPAGEPWTTDHLPALDFLAEVRAGPDDRGLAALPDVLAEAVTGVDGVALAVVTGRPEPAASVVLADVRPWFLTTSLVRLGPRTAGSAPGPPGVVTVDADTSTRFAALWNELVTR